MPKKRKTPKIFPFATTSISPGQTAHEIHALLGRKAAKKILSEYEGGEIAAISFLLEVGPREIAFKIPVKWKECLDAMESDPKTPDRFCNVDQAKRTAWRLALNWLKIQIAFVEARQAKMEEVMLPYAQTPSGKTLFETMEEKGFKAIPQLEE